MEFDSLGAYSGVSAPMTAQTASVRPQPRNIESQQSSQDVQTETVAETQDRQVEYKMTSGSSEKNTRERSDQNDADSALAKAIESANKKLSGTNYGFQYSVHEKTKLVMIKVVNSETQETIREVPPQKHLDAVAKMWELAGILVDEKR